MADSRRSNQELAPTGTCGFPGCDRATRKHHEYCFDCRRKVLPLSEGE